MSHLIGDAIVGEHARDLVEMRDPENGLRLEFGGVDEDRKSTRLNSSHSQISYAVFCLKKKKRKKYTKTIDTHTKPRLRPAACCVVRAESVQHERDYSV